MDIHEKSVTNEDGDANEEIVADANIHEKTFDLAPETALLVAEDLAATGDRKPASDDVDAARAAAARAIEVRS